MSAARDEVDPRTGLRRAVGRWPLLGLSINDVVGSGIYLLPAAAAALLGPASLLGVAVAGLLVALLVLVYAQAASWFDRPGAAYLYTREAFGDFVGFEVGWMTWLTRLASAAALANGLAQAVTHFWPAAAEGAGRVAVVAGSLLLLTTINAVGVRASARTAVFFVVCKMVPLLAFVLVGMWFLDPARLVVSDAPDAGRLGEAALLLLFAYAGFENSPAAAGEYRNPRRDLPFALLGMIAVVTVVYVAVQAVALGTLPGLAGSAAPLAEAAAGFGGASLAWLLTIGAAFSILGTNNNTLLFGSRYLYALGADGHGPRALAAVHPRFRTPLVAVLATGAISLVLALSGSFVELALLSVVSRLVTYLGTCFAVLRLAPRMAGREGALRLPGGPLLPVLAIGLSLLLLAATSWANIVAAGVALLVGALLYRYWRHPPADAREPSASPRKD